MGDTAQYGGAQASFHEAHHAAQALQWHMRSNSDNNGMLREADARELPDSLAHTERATIASGVTLHWIRAMIPHSRSLNPSKKLNYDLINFLREHYKRSAVRIRPNAYHDVGRYFGCQ